MTLLKFVIDRIRKHNEEYKQFCEETDREFEETIARNKLFMEQAKIESTKRRQEWREKQKKKQEEQSPWFSALKRGHFE